MNVTVATEMMRLDFGYTHEQFENKAARVPPARTACCCLRISKANARRTSDGTGVK